MSSREKAYQRVIDVVCSHRGVVRWRTLCRIDRKRERVLDLKGAERTEAFRYLL